MPISEFQRAVFGHIKKHRNPESYIAGGTAINLLPESPRFSNDIDIFHDSDLAVATAFQADVDTLLKAGFSIDFKIRQPSFNRAVVTKGGKQIVLEWARDTAFRFFPVIEDAVLGYRLHDCDLGINKCIAWANRAEVRDALDMIEIHKNILALAACAWAACGKDPGFTPNFILSMMERNSIFSPDMLAAEALNKQVDPVALKHELRAMLSQAKIEVRSYPSADVGCLYLDQNRQVVRHPNGEVAATYDRHFGSLKGSWPRAIG